MRKIVILLGALCLQEAYAQQEGRVGINTETPKATLQVNATTSDPAKGLLIPQMTGDELKDMTLNLTPEQHSMLVFVNKPITDNSAAGFENIIIPAYYRFLYDESKADAYKKTWVRVEPSGLEKVKQESKTGWRLIGADPTKYGKIGTYAVDLSNSNTPSSTFGATGNYSLAMGYNTTASGTSSIAMGNKSKATGTGAFAVGGYNDNDPEHIASGSYSAVIGYANKAANFAAIALGNQVTASANSSIAMGYKTNASGKYSFAVGEATEATGTGAFAVGGQKDENNKHIASGSYSAVIGYANKASDFAAIALGNQVTASANSATAMGYNTVASGKYSFAAGGTANGEQTHHASGNFSAVVGSSNIATNYGSVAMGYRNQSNGFTSFAMGTNVVANGYGAAVFGTKTKSNAGYTMVIGTNNFLTSPDDPELNNLPYLYNINDYEAFVIGNGGATDQQAGTGSNAFIVLRNGKTGIGVAKRKPVEMLEVEGAIKLSTTTSACSNDNRGTIKYENDNFYGCKSSGWVLLNN